MNEAQRPDATFHCPACGGVFEVTTPVREALQDVGCVLCGSAVPASAFVSR